MFVLVTLSLMLASPLWESDDSIQYSVESIEKYGSSSSWAYINRFVTPYVFPKLDQCEGKTVLDAGCGVGLWSFYAAKKGAMAYGIDVQDKMIEIANELAIDEGVEERVSFSTGDVTALAFGDHFFDMAMSINVACNLTNDGVKTHFSELQRVLKERGECAFIAPTSLEVVFTNGQINAAEARQQISTVLAQVPLNPTLHEVQDNLNTLEYVLSATFFLQEGKLTLLTDLSQVVEGQSIYRKLPNLTIPNRYHTESFYKEQILATGLQIEQEIHPIFTSNEERLSYNEKLPDKGQLGPNYLEHTPFIVFHLRNFA